MQAQGVAARIDGFPADQIPTGHFGKGVYFRLTGKAPTAAEADAAVKGAA